MGGAVKAVTETVSKVAGAVSKVTPILSKVSPLLSAASLGFQLYSATQARKSQKQAARFETQRAEESRNLERSRSRQAAVQARQQRLAALREQRIRTGQIVAATGGAGLGLTGTSSFTGSVGGLSSQAAANIGQVNVGESFAREQSGYSIAAGQAASQSAQASAQATGWQQMGTLAQGISTQYGNIFKSPDIS